MSSPNAGEHSGARGTKREYDSFALGNDTSYSAPAPFGLPPLPRATSDITTPSLTSSATILEDTSTHHPQQQSTTTTTKQAAAKTSPKASRSQASSAFRNVSACNRCRLRKNRCDQQLPACKPCEKAGLQCTSFDPLLNRETPRSYVYYLESRAAYLEELLEKHAIQYTSGQDFALSGTSENEISVKKESIQPSETPGDARQTGRQSPADPQDVDGNRADKLGWSGISFARVVLQSIKSSVNRTSSDRDNRAKAEARSRRAGPSSMRESVFGLQTKTSVQPAPFPSRDVGLRLANLYFQISHPQTPVLHRGQFMSIFERVYDQAGHIRTARESYFLNIVFAIGAGIIVDNPTKDEAERVPLKRAKMSEEQRQPEEYHASAIVHLEGHLTACSKNDITDGVSGALEELQAVLLLANFALLRPVAPGLWYITGTAVRLALDLGLHHEEGQDDSTPDNSKVTTPTTTKIRSAEHIGRRQWMRELRRRLWWCTYSFDRQISMCVGRPCGVSDQVITTEFPSLLDDIYMSPAGLQIQITSDDSFLPSSKFVTHHYLRLRLLQSEIMQVLQHVAAQSIHVNRSHAPNEYVYTGLGSPFLQPYSSFRHWRIDVDRRLWEWKESAPSRQETGVEFSPLFYDLNYWQAVIMLYRPSLTAPVELSKELDSFDDYSSESPGATSQFDEQGDEEFVCLKIAEAGQKVLKLYRQLHRVRLVNYTYLSTHSLFNAGISFLYAIWHSPIVRSHLRLDDVDFTILAATSVLSDLNVHCPPAAACKDAFDRMSKATVQMCMATTGFGPNAVRSLKKDHAVSSTAVLRTPGLVRGVSLANTSQSFGQANSATSSRFDMNLSDLFSETETKSQTSSRPSYGLQTFNTYTQPHTVEQYKQQQSSTQSRPVSQPVSDVYQQTVQPMADASDMMDYNSALTVRLSSTSPYAQRQHPPEQFLQPDTYAPSQSTLPLQLEAQLSSSSGFGTGLALPMDATFEHGSFEAFNDADFDFNNLNTMIAGGAALWDDGGWSAGLMGAAADDQSGIAGAGIEGSEEMSSGLGHTSGNVGGNGTIDMFDGLFFG